MTTTELTELIDHPENLDRDTLYELRSMLALYPYFQTVRLLMLKNLYLLHDPSFDEELRKAAIYITDRRTLFNMVEAAHYKLAHTEQEQQDKSKQKKSDVDTPSRTISLIDNFLETIPQEQADDTSQKKRKPTAADAAVDYVAYLMETEDSEGVADGEQDVPLLKGQSLIDTFIENDKGKIVLNETPQYKPQLDNTTDDEQLGNHNEENYFTETLSRIYIKQGRYDKALEIIKRLDLNNPKKNTYFADQIRFLEKLIINNNKK